MHHDVLVIEDSSKLGLFILAQVVVMLLVALKLILIEDLIEEVLCVHNLLPFCVAAA